MLDIERLMGADSIEEWIGLHDERLLVVTGLERVSQELGARLRRRWEIGADQEAILTAGVTRLLVPEQATRASIHKSTDVEMGYLASRATVTLGFDSVELAQRFLPLIARNIAFENDDSRAWTTVGLAGGSLGLAVFTEEPGFDHEVEARIQAIRPELAIQLSDNTTT